MSADKNTTIESYFRRQTVRWSLVSFFSAAVISIPIFFYAQKTVSERQLLTVAKAGATAYRPMILEGAVRDAEIQMHTALSLRDGESAVIRDTNLEPVYAVDAATPKLPNCYEPNLFCWSQHFHTVSLLYPLYFDEPENKNLFGYLELTMRPALDYSILFCLLLVLFGAFVGNSVGLFSVIGGATRKLSSIFEEWGAHLKTAPDKRLEKQSAVPFDDLVPVVCA
jgi:hypothetical protein